MLIDANILVYAADRRSRFHEPARRWLVEQLNGTRRVGIPWQNLTTFMRLMTSTRAMEQAIPPSEAWEIVVGWLEVPQVWTPAPGPEHREILGGLIEKYEIHGDLVADAALAAIAIEQGLTVCSADTDFARFSEVDWHNPVQD